jgi:hypothetical protein
VRTRSLMPLLSVGPASYVSYAMEPKAILACGVMSDDFLTLFVSCGLGCPPQAYPFCTAL